MAHFKNFRSGYDKNLYFPLLNNDSTRSSQIQLANVYDLQGNNLLIDELVLMDRNYEFRRFPSSVHALIGKCLIFYEMIIDPLEIIPSKTTVSINLKLEFI